MVRRRDRARPRQAKMVRSQISPAKAWSVIGSGATSRRRLLSAGRAVVSASANTVEILERRRAHPLIDQRVDAHTSLRAAWHRNGAGHAHRGLLDALRRPGRTADFETTWIRDTCRRSAGIGPVVAVEREGRATRFLLRTRMWSSTTWHNCSTSRRRAPAANPQNAGSGENADTNQGGFDWRRFRQVMPAQAGLGCALEAAQHRQDHPAAELSTANISTAEAARQIPPVRYPARCPMRRGLVTRLQGVMGCAIAKSSCAVLDRLKLRSADFNPSRRRTATALRDALTDAGRPRSSNPLILAERTPRDGACTPRPRTVPPTRQPPGHHAFV